MRPPRSWSGVGLALSFVLGCAMTGQHRHAATAESPAACAICTWADDAWSTPTATEIGTLSPDVDAVGFDQTPRRAGHPPRIAGGRTRAPPALDFSS